MMEPPTCQAAGLVSRASLHQSAANHFYFLHSFWRSMPPTPHPLQVGVPAAFPTSANEAKRHLANSGYVPHGANEDSQWRAQDLGKGGFPDVGHCVG